MKIRTLTLTTINKNDTNFSMKYLRSEKGELTLKTIVILLVLAVGGYLGWKMAVPFVRYQQVKEVFRNQVAQLKTAKEPVVRKETLKQVAELGVEFYTDDDYDDGLRIIREEDQPIIMEAEYEHMVYFIGGFEYKYVFYPQKVAKWK